jgi:hypothetical protein
LAQEAETAFAQGVGLSAVLIQWRSTALINASGTIPVNAETQLAVSFDATTKTTRIYSNGSQVATGTNITYEPWQLYAIAADNRNYIGRTQWWDSSVAADNVDFKGTIDAFMLYNIALTPEEIVQLHQGNTSVGKIEKKTFNISPNPANRNSDICIRPADNAKSQLDIFNLQGNCWPLIPSKEKKSFCRNIQPDFIFSDFPRPTAIPVLHGLFCNKKTQRLPR